MSELYNIFRQHPTISTDSRKVPAGSIFFALRGGNFDGNQFAIEAIKAGASYAVVDDPSIKGDNIILVDNVLRSLQSLATHHRTELQIPIIGLTGSSGKTTTKEFITRVLSTKYNVGATVGNLNNHIGVPLTILSFTDATEIGVVEMGASHIGDIKLLCEIAQPTVGLITNIGRAHLEGFGSPEGVIQAKGELYDWLQNSAGTAIYNQDDATLSKMIAERKGLNAINYHASQKFNLSIYGDYNQLNANAAHAIGKYFKISEPFLTQAIESYIPTNNRSQIIKTERNTLYMDAYNANPSSMHTAIEYFGKQDIPNKRLILGEMGELGKFAQSEHHGIIRQIKSEEYRSIFLVGSKFEEFADADHIFFRDVDHLIDYLKTEEISDSHILIKGSRSVALERITDFL